MAKTHDDSGLYFDHGIHLGLGYLYLGTESTLGDEDDESGVDYAMAERAVKGLHVLDAGAKDITIWLNSMGGDVCHGFAIYDAIARCRNHVTVVGTGNVMSMAVWILQAADTRLLTPSARVMVHVGSAGTEDHLVNLQRYAEEMKRLDRLAEDILLARIQVKHPGYTRAKLQRLCLFDSYLSAQEAVDLGLADGILGAEPRSEG